VVLARGQKEYASSADLTEQKQVLPALHQDKTPSSSRPSYRLQATPPAWIHPTERRTTFCCKFEIRTETSLPASPTGSPYVSSSPRQTLRTQSPTTTSRATLGRHFGRSLRHQRLEQASADTSDAVSDTKVSSNPRQTLRTQSPTPKDKSSCSKANQTWPTTNRRRSRISRCQMRSYQLVRPQLFRSQPVRSQLVRSQLFRSQLVRSQLGRCPRLSYRLLRCQRRQYPSR
jgi:hypothetical protein